MLPDRDIEQEYEVENYKEDKTEATDDSPISGPALIRQVELRSIDKIIKIQQEAMVLLSQKPMDNSDLFYLNICLDNYTD